MSGPFFNRLRDYYAKVASVLRGEADAAFVFPNSSDVGMSRERVYAQFLRQHAPSKCNVFFGEFLFGEDGSESRQLDVIVTTDTTPQFNFHNSDGHGKSFSPVEGTLCAVSIKSNLNKPDLENALFGLASIPSTSPLEKRINPLIRINKYDDWPFKVIYATNGPTLATLMNNLHSFSTANPDIPACRLPNIIHVSGQYIVCRMIEGFGIWDKNIKKRIDLSPGIFHPIIDQPDVQGMLFVLDNLQTRATASSHII